ncbi:hypothetical protein ACWEQ8_39280 [Streptomyces noursei]
MASQRPASRTLDALASPGLANLIGLVGIITPVVAWATKAPDLKNILLAAETGIVVVLVGLMAILENRQVCSSLHLVGL